MAAGIKINATTTGKDCAISSNDKKDNNDNHFDSNNKTALRNSEYTTNNSLEHRIIIGTYINL